MTISQHIDDLYRLLAECTALLDEAERTSYLNAEAAQLLIAKTLIANSHAIALKRQIEQTDTLTH
jgi:hypothetical protein